jgi:hypothetical protein
LAVSLRTVKLDLGGDEQQIEDDELSYAIKAAHIDELFDWPSKGIGTTPRL